MKKSEILEVLINHYAGGNKAKFAARLGIKPQTINSWLVRDTFDFELIYAKCENISGDWLLSGGNGSMLINTQNAQEPAIVISDGGSAQKIRVMVELDLTMEEFVKFGLRDKVIKCI